MTLSKTGKNLVQITDTHIYGDPAARLAGTDTRKTLIQVLDLICSSHSSFHLVLTGDISMDGSEASYEWISGQLKARNQTYSILPGNHDSIEPWGSIFSEVSSDFPTFTLVEPWKFVYLNTQVQNEEYGQVCPDSLKFLRSHISAKDASFLVIFMHHPPFSVGSNWIDKIGLNAGRDEFLRLIQHPKIKLVVSGHVHQESQMEIGSVKLVTSPSTCVQFKPYSDVFALGNSNPGYRLITLWENGEFSTEVVRLT